MTKSTARKRRPHHEPALPVQDQLNYLFATARPVDYREAILEIYHNYISTRHCTLPVEFDDIAHRVHVLVEFFKIMDDAYPAPTGKIQPPNPPHHD